MSDIPVRIYEFGAFRVDTLRRLLLREEVVVRLPAKAFEILLVLLEEKGSLVEKDELMRRVWPDAVVEENNLTVNMSALRKSLGETPGEHRYLVTVPGHGYQFVADVRSDVDETAKKSAESSFNEPAILAGSKTEKTASSAETVLPGRTATGSRSFLLRGVGIVAVAGALSAFAYLFWLSRNPRLVEQPPRVIAVLPFKPLAAENRDEPLEMGMCNALITKLSGLNRLVVRPTSSVVTYNQVGQDPLVAGRELGADALLEGYIQRSGDRIRVTAQLLNVADGKSLWSGQFSEPFTDIFNVEDSISSQMAEALLRKLTDDEQKLVKKHSTENVEAYELYLKGRFFLDKGAPDSLRKSIDYFQQALEKDPKYALAFAGLADSYVVLAVRVDMAPRDSYQKAKAAATRALEIDDSISEAHTSLAKVRFWYDWDWSGAESESKRAIQLGPNSPVAHQQYAVFLMAMERQEEAASQIIQAQRLAPVSFQINVQAARVFFFAHRYDDVVDQCKKILELDPNFTGAHMFLGRSYTHKRMYPEALAELDEARKVFKDSAEVLAIIGYTYGVSGRRLEAQKILNELQQLSKERYISPYHLAMVDAGLGKKDDAFAELDKAYTDREGRMTLLKVVPEFANLRSDPRFTKLLQRIGLSS